MEHLRRTRSFFSTGSLSAYLDEVTTSSGRVKERLRVDHPEAAAVLAFLDSREILMVRQFRYGAGLWTLELPAGKVDRGESPEECARRELFEETGYRAKTLEKVLEFHPAAAYSSELLHIFSASGLEGPFREEISDEIARVETRRVEEALDMVFAREITDAKTIIGLFLARDSAL